MRLHGYNDNENRENRGGKRVCSAQFRNAQWVLPFAMPRLSSVSLIRQFRSNANAGSLRGGGQPGTLALVAPILVMAFGWSVPPAHAGVVDVAVGANVTQDSNLFRQSDSLGPSSDVISSGYLGLRIDKPYAQQRFQADLTETTTRHEEFPNLNSDTFAYRGAWLWHLTPRISGSLGADRTQSLVSFADTSGTTRNLRVSQNRQLSLDAFITGGWHVLFGISRATQASESATLIEPDFRSKSAEAAIRYEARSGSSISVLRRRSEGRYADTEAPGAAISIANQDYRQDESDVQTTWIFSRRSTLTGRVTWIERRHDRVSQRDFSGLAGNLGYNWTPPGKIAVAFSAQRALYPRQEGGATYGVDNSYSVAPTWQVSAKTTVHARKQRVKSYLSGATVRRDTTTDSLFVEASWAPRTSVTTGVSLEHQRRTSDNEDFEFDTTIARISAAIRF